MSAPMRTTPAVRKAIESGEVIGLAARFAVRAGIKPDVAVALFRCAYENELERVTAAAAAPTEPPPAEPAP